MSAGWTSDIPIKALIPGSKSEGNLLFVAIIGVTVLFLTVFYIFGEDLIIADLRSYCYKWDLIGMGFRVIVICRTLIH